MQTRPTMYADVDYFFNLIFALLASFTRLIMLMVYEVQPNPYMDEIFHVPQVQAYCNYSFSTWDPMITTLPGLYLFSLGLLKPLGHVLKSDLCQTYYLRIINVGFCIGIFYTLSMIVTKKQGPKTQNAKLATLSGLSMSLFPILYFFNFLYYTDLGSTFFVLFAYLLHLHNYHKSSAVVGAMSVLFRQTNIVWVVFMGWVSGYPVLVGEKRSARSELNLKTNFKANLQFVLKPASNFNFKPLANLFVDVVGIVWPYLVVVVAFASFLVLNGGIVLGAKSDHEAGLHLCQILYFSLFSFAFLLPVLPICKVLREFSTFCRRTKKAIIMFLILTLLVIHFTTTTHRYLISDNRHYTFYVWKNIFQRHPSVRYLLAPFYVFSMFALWSSLGSAGRLWKLGFSTCLSLALAPSSLLEFRYFIVPFLLVRLNLEPQPGFIKILLETLAYLAVNSFAIYMFLYKPFTWPGSDELQRFMY